MGVAVRCDGTLVDITEQETATQELEARRITSKSVQSHQEL